MLLAAAAGDVAKPHVGEYGDGGETGQPVVRGGEGYGGAPWHVPSGDGIADGDADGDGPQTLGSALAGGPRGGGIGNRCAPGICLCQSAAAPAGCRPHCASSSCPNSS